MIIRGKNEFVFLDKNGKKQKYITSLRNSFNANAVIKTINSIDKRKYDKFIYCKSLDFDYFWLPFGEYKITYEHYMFDKREKETYKGGFGDSSNYELFDMFYLNCKKLYPVRVVEVENVETSIVIEGLNEKFLKKGTYKVYYSPYNMKTQVVKRKMLYDDTAKEIIAHFNFFRINDILCIKDEKGHKYLDRFEPKIDYALNKKIDYEYGSGCYSGMPFEILKEDLLYCIRQSKNIIKLKEIDKVIKTKILGIRDSDEGFHKSFLPLSSKERIYSTTKGKEFFEDKYGRELEKNLSKEVEFRTNNIFSDEAIKNLLGDNHEEYEKNYAKRKKLENDELKKEMKRLKITQ